MLLPPRTALFVTSAILCLAALATAADKNPLRPADTSSPQDTLTSFIETCNETYLSKVRFDHADLSRREREAIMARITECLDLSQVPPSVRDDFSKEAAVCLKEVLDRIKPAHLKQAPGDKDVEAAAENGGLLRWRIPESRIAIERIAEGPREGEYLFDSDTVLSARAVYEVAKEMPYLSKESPDFYRRFVSEPGWMIPNTWIQSLPQWFRNRVWGQAVWQWIGLVVTLAVGILVMFLTYRFGRRLARVGPEASVLRYCFTLVFPIVAMLVPVLVDYFVSKQLRLTGNTLAVVKFSTDIIFLIALLVVVIGAGNRVAEIIISSPRINPKGIDAQFVRLISRVISLAAGVVVFLEGGRMLGVPLTTLLAGAGVGGLAFALAAQDTLKNMFGSMMIILDKPFRVGERIVTKGYDGVVEEIGLRSTKIRLLTGHQVAIPNEELARTDIENIGRRPHIRRKTSIAIPIDTPAEKVEQALQIVRQALDNHEGMDPGYPPRINFTEFNRDSLNLQVMYWYHPPNYWDFLAFGEKANMQIKQQFEEADIRFALPTSTTVMTRDDDRPLTVTMVPGEQPDVAEKGDLQAGE